MNNYLGFKRYQEVLKENNKITTNITNNYIESKSNMR